MRVGLRYLIERLTVGPAPLAMTLAAVRMMSNAPARMALCTQPGAPSYGAVKLARPTALGGSNSVVRGRAIGLPEPMITSNGMAADSTSACSAWTVVSENRVMGTGPSSGTKTSSRSASAAACRATSASRSGGATEVTVTAMRRRTAAASSSLPSLLHGLAAGSATWSPTSVMVSSESSQIGRVPIEDGQHGRRAPRRHPEDDLVNSLGLEVAQLLIGEDRSERDHPDGLRIAAASLDRPAEPGP